MLVDVESTVRVVTGTDGKRKRNRLGLVEKKVRANERQKEVQGMRQMGYGVPR